MDWPCGGTQSYLCNGGNFLSSKGIEFYWDGRNLEGGLAPEQPP